MRIDQIHVENYKSLRNVRFHPGSFAVLVGPNAAGKSNLADGFDFLSMVYRHGLEHAVALKGGYENIAFRKKRRARSALRFEVTVVVDQYESPFSPTSTKKRKKTPAPTLTVSHSFSFRAHGEGIRANFAIENETIHVQYDKVDRDMFDDSPSLLIERDKSGAIEITKNSIGRLDDDLRFMTEYFERQNDELTLPNTDLFVTSSFFRTFLFGMFLRSMSQIAVYQFSSELGRDAGVPTPNPNLSAGGKNLPAVIDWLQRNQSREWRYVMSAMREIVPTLEDITVQYLHTKTLGLFFTESGIGRDWSAEDMSDGTIRSLAILVSAVDPRTSLLVIEELENSVHPWIIRILMKRLRELSKRAPVILTTHSPVVVNLSTPAETWVVYKTGVETHVSNLTELDPDSQHDWEQGRYRLAEYLDSGAIAELIPGGVL